MYEETEKGVRSVSAYELKNAVYSTDYKSYYIDRQNQIVGIGVIDYEKTENTNRYILLGFDGYELIELVNVSLAGEPENMRGVYIDGYMYMFGEYDFKVINVLNQ